MARFDLKYSDVHIFSARHIAYMLSALYAVARPVYHRLTVEVRSMKFSPYGSPIFLVLRGKFHP